MSVVQLPSSWSVSEADGRSLDAEEVGDWLDSLDAARAHHGPTAVTELLARLQKHARTQGARLPWPVPTDDVNTIPPEQEPDYPGAAAIEERIQALIRWNAAVMVMRANRPEIGVGGYIATYAAQPTSTRSGSTTSSGAAAPRTTRSPATSCSSRATRPRGIDARAFLEGRLSEDQLDLFRQESSRTGDRRPGLSSYPHPRSLPDFWEFPTVSMGLAAPLHLPGPLQPPPRTPRDRGHLGEHGVGVRRRW